MLSGVGEPSGTKFSATWGESFFKKKKKDSPLFQKVFKIRVRRTHHTKFSTIILLNLVFLTSITKFSTGFDPIWNNNT